MIEMVTVSKRSPRVREENKEILNQTLKYCFALMALRDQNLPSEAERNVLFDYVLRSDFNYSNLDIKNAFILYTQKKLDYTESHFQFFSVLFLENVMQSYKRYIINLPKPQPKPIVQEEPSPAEIEAIMYQAFIREYETVKRGEKAIDYGNAVYEWMDKKGLIKFSAQRKMKFYQQAINNLKSQAYKNRTANLVQDTMRAIEVNKGDIVVTEAKKIALTVFFQEIIELDMDINEIFNLND